MRGHDEPEVDAPAPGAEVEVELPHRPAVEALVATGERLVVAVEPAVHGEARPDPPAEAQPGAEGHDVEAPVAAERLGEARRAARADLARAVERDGPLVADLHRAAHLAEADRPGEGREVERLPVEAVVVRPPLGVERVRDPHHGDLGNAQVAEAGRVPGGRGRVVGAREKRASHAVGPGPRAEREVLAARDVDAAGVPHRLLSGRGSGGQEEGEGRRTPCGPGGGRRAARGRAGQHGPIGA